MEIKKYNEFFNESNAVEDLTEYELKIKNEYSKLKRGEGDGLIDLGKITDVSDIDISNIKKTYPKSRILTKNGRYLLSVKENTKINESKISDKLIEISEKLYSEIFKRLGEDKLKDIKNIDEETLNELASEILEHNDLEIFFSSKDLIVDLIEDEYSINIKENNEYDKDEEYNIFDYDDEEYNKNHLKRGEEIQKEHKPTYNKIKKFHEITGELPEEDNIYKSIAKDHMDEEDGIGKLYYDEEDGLETWEEELKKKWKKKKDSE